MSRYWHPRVQALHPYVPGEQPKLERLVKLNTNENPYGPSPQVIAAIQAAAAEGMQLYPDPESSALRAAIADYYGKHGITPANVFVGNGSDEVLAHAFHALFRQDAPLLFPDISYSFYPVYCGLYELAFETIPLDAHYGIQLGDYARNNGGIIFPNPNAPTGRALPLRDIRALLEANTGSVVVVDEAYVDFGAETAIALVRDFPNLLVTQTVSKSRSLAGLRLGLAIGDPDLIEGLVRIKDSFNSYPIDRLASAGGIAAFADREYFEQTRAAVIRDREQLSGELGELGFEVLPSAANFVFAHHPDHDAARLAQALREQAVIVRHFAKPRIAQFLRISVGNPAQNQALLQALGRILQGWEPGR